MPIVNFYAGSALDRASHHRKDAAWLATRLGDPSSRVVPVWNLQNLIRPASTPEAVTLDMRTWSASIPTHAPPIFLGIRGGQAHFAVDAVDHDPSTITALARDSFFTDLRNVGPLMAGDDGALLAYARGLVYWHSRHRFCGVCGAPTEPADAGHLRLCTDPACATQHFPRTDPAVIMLVVHEDRCLLGRQPGWMTGMNSTLAGFVEPGESLEEAVAREVFEETGVRTADIRYHSSQPWPFPASIMLGFTATATSTALSVNRAELESAAWYSRDYLRGSHDPEVFRLPRIDSIARRLIEDWLAEG